MFALRPIPAGMRLVRYRGEVIGWAEAVARYEATGVEGLTYFFDRGDGTVIDGEAGGNSARFLNHSCRPNCEAIDHDGAVWIHTIADLAPGDELCIDYALTVDDPDEPDQRRHHACRCAHPTCRGTLLA